MGSANKYAEMGLRYTYLVMMAINWMEMDAQVHAIYREIGNVNKIFVVSS